MDELAIAVGKLPPMEKEHLRKKIVRMMMKHGDTGIVSEICECSRRHVQNVWKTYRDGGVAAIKTKTLGRPLNSGALNEEQQTAIRKLIVDNCPNQMKLKGFLWDRAGVQALIKQRYKVTLTLQDISKYLKKWGMTPQRPILKNYKQEPEEVKKWLEKDYPAIAERAKEEDAEIHWGDETGCQNESNYVKGYAPKGQTPELPFGNDKLRINMISSITNRGKLRFMFYDGSMNARVFLRFIKRLAKGAGRKIFLIVDNLKVHHANLVKEWLEANKDKLELFYLPKYSPEYNPDEYLNGNLKREMAKADNADTKEKLESNARGIMKRLQHNEPHVAKLFLAKRVKYASA